MGLLLRGSWEGLQTAQIRLLILNNNSMGTNEQASELKVVCLN